MTMVQATTGSRRGDGGSIGHRNPIIAWQAPPVVALTIRDGRPTLTATTPNSSGAASRSSGQEVALHPRPFGIAVTGAAVFALATVASSWALGRVTDKVIVPRFEEGEVAPAPWSSALGLIIGIGLVKAAASSCAASRPPSPARASGDPAPPRSSRRYQEVPYRYHRRTPDR